MSEQNIETFIRPHCPACGASGKTVYKDLRDRLFDAPGLWKLSKCNNPQCGTLWLNPGPLEEDIPKLYTRYSTHLVAGYNTPKEKKGVSAILEAIRSAYLHRHYGYPETASSLITKLLSLVAYIDPSWKDIQSANIFYLPYIENGELLDIGCGNGSSMQVMRSKGWQVAGIDFDEQAIRAAQQQKLNARVGDLFSQKFPSEKFDAIMMNHVIEHVPEPKKLLEECWRILKKDGVLVSLTPNAYSRGHAKYKDKWRGLETPQHLQIFTVASLKEVARLAGFKNIRSFSSIQGGVYISRASANIAKGLHPDTQEQQNFYTKIRGALFLYLLGWLRLLNPNHDEVAVLVCKK